MEEGNNYIPMMGTERKRGSLTVVERDGAGEEDNEKERRKTRNGKIYGYRTNSNRQ